MKERRAPKSFEDGRRRWKRRARVAGARAVLRRFGSRGGARVALALWIGAVEASLFLWGAAYVFARRGHAV
jgi:hypothetical protein